MQERYQKYEKTQIKQIITYREMVEEGKRGRGDKEEKLNRTQ